MKKIPKPASLNCRISKGSTKTDLNSKKNAQKFKQFATGTTTPKMLIEFKNQYKDIEIIAGIIKINKNYDDKTLISAVAEICIKNIRADDFAGHFGDNKFLIILYNCAEKNFSKTPINTIA